MTKTRLPTNAKWFRPLGACVCGKSSTGDLMNTRNDRLGSYCAKCAALSIRQSEAAQREWEAARGTILSDALKKVGGQ